MKNIILLFVLMLACLFASAQKNGGEFTPEKIAEMATAKQYIILDSTFFVYPKYDPNGNLLSIPKEAKNISDIQGEKFANATLSEIIENNELYAILKQLRGYGHLKNNEIK